jgi:hypothetical protein
MARSGAAVIPVLLAGLVYVAVLGVGVAIGALMNRGHINAMHALNRKQAQDLATKDLTIANLRDQLREARK